VSRPTIRRAGLLAAALAPLILGGCATSAPTEPTATSTTTHGGAAEAAQYASTTPPSAATMICSDEIRSEIAAALGIASVPAPTSTWADHVYTCTYTPSPGRLVLSVTVTPSNAAARAQLTALRTRLGASAEEPGLGQQGYSSPGGAVVAVKDNMVLTVDPGSLPDDLGATHEKRLDFARVIAGGVFSCWKGD
jgi:hypothetical protein